MSCNIAAAYIASAVNVSVNISAIHAPACLRMSEYITAVHIFARIDIAADFAAFKTKKQ